MSAEDESGWFPGDEATPFVERVRLLAPGQLGHLIAASATWTMELGGCLLVVDVPDVPDGEVPVITNNIQVRWDSDTLGGYWGCSHLWDDFDERDTEALVVRGVPMSDEEAAKLAVGWLSRQLGRPLDLQVWTSGGRVLARRWVLSDTGREVGRRGRHLLRRGAPTAITRLRPVTM